MENKVRLVLEETAKLLRDYEQNHLQKVPPDFVKAARNRDAAMKIEKLLNPTDANIFEEDET
jgi:hypothetical protein